MTGRDLIIYILQNGLENEPVINNGRILGFLTLEEVAIKCNVGTSTVRTWVHIGLISGVQIGDTIYIPANVDLETIKSKTITVCNKNGPKCFIDITTIINRGSE